MDWVSISRNMETNSLVFRKLSTKTKKPAALDCSSPKHRSKDSAEPFAQKARWERELCLSSDSEIPNAEQGISINERRSSFPIRTYFDIRHSLFLVRYSHFVFTHRGVPSPD